MSILLATLIIEALICLISLYAAIRRGRKHFYGFFVTFVIYFYYDLIKNSSIRGSLPSFLFSKFMIQQGTVDVLFLIAAISAIVTIWKVYKRF